jgi:NAD(P)-dependent dehydrogenase (short-subunit alcohol dehydrogenase family)
VEVFEADLSSVASVQALVAQLKLKLTHVDVLVNAAAVTRPALGRETSVKKKPGA